MYNDREKLRPSEQHERARQPWGPLPIVLSIIAGVMIIGIGSFMAWQFSSHSNAGTVSSVGSGKIGAGSYSNNGGKIGSSGNGASTDTATNVPSKGKVNNQSSLLGQNDPEIYWSTLQDQFAQGLHLSTSEVQSRLQTESGQAKAQHSDLVVLISNLAQKQGISTDQLRTVEINAIQQGSAKLVSQRALTQSQADQRIQIVQSWDQNALDQYILNAFSRNQNTQKQ